MSLAPIFIPSRGRAKTASTPRLLASAGIPFNLVVEPKEFAAYSAAFPGSVISLICSDRGLCYARNLILDHARDNKVGWFWMLDDDIDGFFRQSGKRSVRADPSVLREAEAVIRRDDAATGSLEYQQYVWSATKDMAVNSYCDVAVLIHSERTRPVRYRPEVEMKEDRDFTLQVISNGWLSVRASRFGFSCPKNGSNSGGLAEAYAEHGREAAASARMAELWPGICEPRRKPDGRPDVKINWRALRPPRMAEAGR